MNLDSYVEKYLESIALLSVGETSIDMEVVHLIEGEISDVGIDSLKVRKKIGDCIAFKHDITVEVVYLMDVIRQSAAIVSIKKSFSENKINWKKEGF